jgi:hypothetical protein
MINAACSRPPSTGACGISGGWGSREIGLFIKCSIGASAYTNCRINYKLISMVHRLNGVHVITPLFKEKMNMNVVAVYIKDA